MAAPFELQKLYKQRKKTTKQILREPVTKPDGSNTSYSLHFECIMLRSHVHVKHMKN